MINIINQFSKNADTYHSHNIIQNKVVKKLVGKISDNPQFLLDIGCGSGAVYNSLNWSPEKFVGVDFAKGMLELHPKNDNVELYVVDFNQDNCFEQIKHYQFDRVISSSALQWANDLEKTFHQISLLEAPVSLAIFTSGTFQTLFSTASISPLLRPVDEVIKLSEKYFNAKSEVLTYSLKFDSVRDMFRYMKKSGVGGGRNILSVKQMKDLMKNYPLDYLEFEIVLIHEQN